MDMPKTCLHLFDQKIGDSETVELWELKRKSLLVCWLAMNYPIGRLSDIYKMVNSSFIPLYNLINTPASPALVSHCLMFVTWITCTFSGFSGLRCGGSAPFHAPFFNLNFVGDWKFDLYSDANSLLKQNEKISAFQHMHQVSTWHKTQIIIMGKSFQTYTNNEGSSRIQLNVALIA